MLRINEVPVMIASREHDAPAIGGPGRVLLDHLDLVAGILPLHQQSTR
jgi:hypothetical protein